VGFAFGGEMTIVGVDAEPERTESTWKYRMNFV
jgi:hypothetical protein